MQAGCGLSLRVWDFFVFVFVLSCIESKVREADRGQIMEPLKPEAIGDVSQS